MAEVKYSVPWKAPAKILNTAADPNKDIVV
jgi:hypothetical protein